MKLKHKAPQSKRHIAKHIPHKRSLQQNLKSTNTTKEQTHVTFESHHDSTECKLDLRSFKTHRYRKSCLDKLQENQLSPFSSPEAKSLTPVIRKQNYGLDAVQFINQQRKRNQSPNLGKDFEIGKKKSKKVIGVNNILKKKKKKGRKKQEETRIQFENEFIRRMQGRPITELSQQELEVTYKKPIKIRDYSYQQDLYRAIHIKPTHNNFNKKTKGELIRQMKQKIISKYQLMYPNLKPNELKILSSVIIIQRLWRQCRVKKFIRDYIAVAPSNPGKQVKSILEEPDETYIKVNNNSQKSQKNEQYLFKQILYSSSKEFLTKKSQTTQHIVEHYQQSPITERQKEFHMLISPRNCKKSTLKINLLHRQNDNFLIHRQEDCLFQTQIHQKSEVYIKESSLIKPQIIWQTPQKNKINTSQINLKDLELSDELKMTQSKQLAFRNFVATYRELALSNSNKNKNKKRINVFDLPQSLSQKCLMQKFYSKLWQNGKGFNIEHDLDEQLSRSLQKRQQLNATKSILKKQNSNCLQNQEQLQRFYTQNHDEDMDRQLIQKIVFDSHKIDIGFEKNHTLQQSLVQIQGNQFQLKQKKAVTQRFQNTNSRQVKSLENINLISEEIVEKLIQQFIDESNPTYKRNQIKKKKRKLPGLTMTHQTIEDYLNGLITYIKEKENQNFVQNFYKINPLTVLKINRIPLEGFKKSACQDEQQQYFENFQDIFPEPPLQYLEQQQLSCDPTIIPKTTFFQYEQIYQDKQVKIDSDDQKYSTFILSICKINNKCLMDTLIEYLQKWRIDGIKYLWDNQFVTKRQKCRNQLSQRENYYLKAKDTKILYNKLQTIISVIQRQAFKKLGKLHRKYEQTQQKKLLLNLRQQYGDQGKDWLCGIQRLEIRLEIVQEIWRGLIQQFTQELTQFC